MLAQQFRRGEILAHQYADELCLRLSSQDLELQAFVDEPGRRERLRAELEQLAAAFPESASRHLLFGHTLGVKDIFHVRGLQTAAGSRLPAQTLAGEESAAVQRLRACGALVLGKTQTTEFAYFAPAPTRNPRASGHTPGGSSSGSAAAVAAGLCSLALGTQTIGSLSRPASYCGVVAYKPTFDRISTSGVIPLAPSFDHVGPLARSVGAVELAAAALVEDWREPEQVQLRDLRFAVPIGSYLNRAQAETRTLFEQLIARLRDRGLEVVELDAFSDFEKIERRHHTLLAAEAAAAHQRWYRRHASLYHPKTAELIERGQGIDVRQIAREREAVLQFRHQHRALTERHEIDLWLSPAAPGPPPRGLASTGDPVMNLPWTQAGVPTLALPAMVTSAGLPIGLQLAGQVGSDETVLACGQQIEQLLGTGQRSPVQRQPA